jgi:hypothetical protein
MIEIGRAKWGYVQIVYECSKMFVAKVVLLANPRA